MKTNALLKLHQRQVDLLDMVIDCNNRIRSKEIDLKQYTINANERWKNNVFGTIKHAEKMIQKYTAIKRRLILYYLDIQQRINAMQPTIELTTSTEMDLVTDKS